MRVEAHRIAFYESLADLGPIEQIGEGTVSAPFHFEGEGQAWDLDVTLTTPDMGKTLVRTDRGRDAAPAPLTYSRCP